MPRYMETAAKANEVAKKLISMVAEGAQPQAAEMIAQLVNLGIRCAPRAVQSTVRKNAVERAVRGLPVEITMEQRTDPQSRKTYNALITKPKGGEATAEGSDGDDE